MTIESKLSEYMETMDNTPLQLTNNPDAILLDPLDASQCVSEKEEMQKALREAAREIDRKVLGAVLLPIDRRVESIHHFSSQAMSQGLDAIHLAVQSRLNRWAIGRMLIGAKKELKTGKFESWIKRHFTFSKSTAENYMRLARNYSTAGKFLEEGGALRDLYNTKAKASDKGASSGGDNSSSSQQQSPTKAVYVMKSLTALQSRMRQFTESGERLSDVEIKELKAKKREIDRFYNQIINQKGEKL